MENLYLKMFRGACPLTPLGAHAFDVRCYVRTLGKKHATPLMNQTLALGYEILRTVELTTKYITKLTWNPVAVQSAAIAVSQIAANSSY